MAAQTLRLIASSGLLSFPRFSIKNSVAAPNPGGCLNTRKFSCPFQFDMSRLDSGSTLVTAINPFQKRQNATQNENESQAALPPHARVWMAL